MALVLYHHPFSRAAGAVWMLEEIGQPYELRFINLYAGEQKSPAVLALNPMGKLPILTDGDTVVTEGAAIALYLADRYSYGTLAPRADDPARGSYLRWSFFAPSVLETGLIAKANGWSFREAQAGWGAHDAMLSSVEHALGHGPYVLGERFSMADVVLGGTVRYMLMTKLIEPRPAFTAYAERLAARPALRRADARNAASVEEHGIKRL